MTADQNTRADRAAQEPDNPSGMACAACRSVGHWHCSDPENCGNMKPMQSFCTCNEPWCKACAPAPFAAPQPATAECPRCGSHGGYGCYECTPPAAPHRQREGRMGAAHGFKVGDIVENGSVRARVIALIADDAMEVIYDGDDEPTIDLAVYFRRAEQVEEWPAQTEGGADD